MIIKLLQYIYPNLKNSKRSQFNQVYLNKKKKFIESLNQFFLDDHVRFVDRLGNKVVFSSDENMLIKLQKMKFDFKKFILIGYSSQRVYSNSCHGLALLSISNPKWYLRHPLNA
ncbi:hypothetical protein BpHYR1_043709 [Brachionus plicatilis]|uniref:Uncharacterized protein n=1 Tax=Brachionus plicatilis TaxID=10195 RepID=A0A3M7T4D0_BRAPC|nr:hypothetical protein BpHYR1_043709 [Brachionus plicatilis]